MAETIYKYARNTISKRRCLHLRRFQDPVQHEKYYAYLKHRCQARYRGERYQLTWTQWQRLWPQELWHRRGRGPRSLRLTQKNSKLGWSLRNCEVVEHSTHMSKINQARTEAKKQNAGPI